MTTARKIIERAHKQLGVLGAGRSLTADEAQDGLDALNGLLESWSVEGGLVFTETNETFNLTTATSYTIGEGADFDTVRPVDIRLITVKQADIDYTLVSYDQIQYGEISQKNLSGIPTVYYFDANQPISTISFYPTPDSVTSCTIRSVKPLVGFQDLDTDLNLGVGYARALEYNLAEELSGPFQVPVPANVAAKASESKTAVFTANARNENNAMTVDDALTTNGTRYDIYRGY
jgi:hypothetical protein